jgi:hypothetical protein
LTEFLIRPATGQVYRRTQVLAKRADLRPHEPDSPEESPSNEAFAVETATKAELAAFARAEYGVTLDSRQRAEELRAKVTELMRD